MCNKDCVYKKVTCIVCTNPSKLGSSEEEQTECLDLKIKELNSILSDPNPTSMRSRLEKIIEKFKELDYLVVPNDWDQTIECFKAYRDNCIMGWVCHTSLMKLCNPSFKTKTKEPDAKELTQIYLDFDTLRHKNIFAAEHKYQDMPIKISGKVEEIWKCEDGKCITIPFEVKRDKYVCGFDRKGNAVPIKDVNSRWIFDDTEDNLNDIIKLRRGKNATVWGIFDAKDSATFSIIVRHCKILDCETDQ